MTTNARRTVGRIALVAMLAAVPLAGCSDDDGDDTSTTEADGSTDTTNDTLPADDPRVVAATEALEAAIGADAYQPPVEIKEASVDVVVIGPVDDTETLDPATAEDICDAALTVALGELPTAKVTVVDGDGTELVVTGVAGCTPAE